MGLADLIELRFDFNEPRRKVRVRGSVGREAMLGGSECLSCLLQVVLLFGVVLLALLKMLLKACNFLQSFLSLALCLVDLFLAHFPDRVSVALSPFVRNRPEGDGGVCCHCVDFRRRRCGRGGLAVFAPLPQVVRYRGVAAHAKRVANRLDGDVTFFVRQPLGDRKNLFLVNSDSGHTGSRGCFVVVSLRYYVTIGT